MLTVLQFIQESPPNIFYGKANSSSGALFSGRLNVKLVDEQVTLTRITAKLVARIVAKKPVAKDCLECQQRDTEVDSWDFLKNPVTMRRDQPAKNGMPVSCRIPGHLPTTTHGILASVEYFMNIIATTTSGRDIKLRYDMLIARALPLPGEKHSLRIFPPTDLQVHLSMVPYIHPIGRFTASFRLSNINCPPSPKRPDMHTRWMIRKLTWKLEENERMISPACDKHASKVGGEGRGREHDEVNILMRDDVFEGFKTDYQAGEIDCEFSFTLTSKNNKRVLCDVDTGTGYTVKHSLIIELIIAEEWQSNSKADKWGATGQARVLRSQFGLTVTERAGLGIAWDEEEPPLYQDMALEPPPTYEHEFGLPPLTEAQRTALAEQARAQTSRGPAPDLPSSPPMYGVNSHMQNLDEAIEDLSLDEQMRRPSPGRAPSSDRRSDTLGSSGAVAIPDSERQSTPAAESSAAAAARESGS